MNNIFLLKNKIRLFLCLLLTLISSIVFCQTNNASMIRYVLQKQEVAWNQGDLQSYMHAYWKSDSVMVIGKSGITYGWEKTLKNYKKGYPDKQAMGKLNFILLEMKPISATFYFVVGKWHLQREVGDLGGVFTLLFKKINGEWLIVADHSS
jgi:ketosteroid isomerase-like protein